MTYTCNTSHIYCLMVSIFSIRSSRLLRHQVPHQAHQRPRWCLMQFHRCSSLGKRDSYENTFYHYLQKAKKECVLSVNQIRRSVDANDTLYVYSVLTISSLLCWPVIPSCCHSLRPTAAFSMCLFLFSPKLLHYYYFFDYVPPYSISIVQETFFLSLKVFNVMSKYI